ncbi:MULTISPECIES: hypothetical protein [unclassified Campylobacter]|uniref:hypothetical protein n=1 Tax=unclassified Campylobacter TaxID=2593542 RepID=UPI0022E9D941|nr:MULTISPECIES: hypothetical protein [unclassified Campylobacter]MDA3042651.1 hypothetical protein [Campylobacter sp. JMF_09 ED2]MDA3044535.1 hypothetical protein [Campylobacter sp. JMF_07 ED4]MDA3063342.1 hypothetical protein [Campylobacter sp. JMF_11 EL3]MDA3071512.1 hypothetical protein [Campylobacter sp. VBCF_03 NA9]MDA3074424.1 hypothetical protein [Campylobacter sp. JMF_05 ED3]
MKRLFFVILCMVGLCLNFAVADDIKLNLTKIDEFFQNTPCDKLNSLDKNEIDKFLDLIFSDNETIYHAISKCDLSALPQENFNEMLALISLGNAKKDDFDYTKTKNDEFALKIAHILNEQNLDFAQLDKVVENLKNENPQNVYFVDFLIYTNNVDLLKFYLDNQAPINPNSRAFSKISSDILIFISHNCPSTKQAIKNKRPSDEILAFIATEKYQNFRNERLKMASEILKHIDKNKFIADYAKAFDDILAITNDETIRNFIQGETNGTK